eukprot:comp21671_c1_seq1/m.30494 comp21671_c1_seq1/g.30494  ORF comp21671_c1_seq1/g.30494 comp21671_c1_seq1/m.30494 type:complete len:469 (-) comp21671_c1_seq1:486-1892(-)
MHPVEGSGPELSALKAGVVSHNGSTTSLNQIPAMWSRWEEEAPTLGEPPVPATDHVSVQMGRNLIVVAGFTNPNNEDGGLVDRESVVYSYNLDTCAWKKHVNKGKEVPAPRAGPSAGAFMGCMYVFGGWCRGLAYTNELWKYDVRACAWTKLGPSSDDVEGVTWPSRRDKADVVAHEGSLYLFGGWGPRQGVNSANFTRSPQHQNNSPELGWNNEFWRFDIQSDRWSRVPTSDLTPQARAAHKLALIGDHMYVVGGRASAGRRSDVHRFDFANMRWSGPLGKGKRRAPMLSPNDPEDSARTGKRDWPVGRVWHSVSPIDSRSLLVFGGMGTKIVEDGKEQALPLDDAWIFDTNLETYRHVGNAPQPRLWHTAVVDETNGELVAYAGRVAVPQENFKDMRNDILKFRYAVPTLRSLCVSRLAKELVRAEAECAVPSHKPRRYIEVSEMDIPVEIFRDVQQKRLQNAVGS